LTKTEKKRSYWITS